MSCTRDNAISRSSICGVTVGSPRGLAKVVVTALTASVDGPTTLPTALGNALPSANQHFFAPTCLYLI